MYTHARATKPGNRPSKSLLAYAANAYSGHNVLEGNSEYLRAELSESHKRTVALCADLGQLRFYPESPDCRDIDRRRVVYSATRAQTNANMRYRQRRVITRETVAECGSRWCSRQSFLDVRPVIID